MTNVGRVVQIDAELWKCSIVFTEKLNKWG